jgi:hypothetical protein
MKNASSVGGAMVLAVVFVSSVAYGQIAKATLIPYPLEFDPDPVLQRSEGTLRAAWIDGLRDRSGIIVTGLKEVEIALKASRRQDCRESNDCLAQLAQKAGTLYAIYGHFAHTQAKQLVLVARVVRDDGKLMGAGRVELPRGKDGLADVFRILLTRLLEQLALKDLPTFKEIEPPLERHVEAVPPPRETIPPPPMPPAEPARPRSSLKTPAFVLLGVGGAGVVAGVLIAGLANPQLDSQGIIQPGTLSPNEAVNRYKAAKTQQTVGTVLAVVGGAAAAAGAILLLIPQENRVTMSAGPVAGGAMIQLGGRFP